MTWREGTEPRKETGGNKERQRDQGIEKKRHRETDGVKAKAFVAKRDRKRY